MITRILFFTAPWCGPCKPMKKLVQGWSNRHDGYPIEFIDTDKEENDKICEKYSVRSMPTVIIVDGRGTERLRIDEPKDIHKLSKFNGCNCD